MNASPLNMLNDSNNLLILMEEKFDSQKMVEIRDE